MTKEEVIEFYKSLPNLFINDDMLLFIDKTLSEYESYEINNIGGTIKVNSIMDDEHNSKYIEIVCGFTQETKYLVTTTKDIGYARNLNPYDRRPGLNIFTTANSYVYNANNLLLHESWFSDDFKSFDKVGEEIDFSVSGMREMIQNTNPEYERGYMKRTANRCSQPFSNIWNRYNKTHVYVESGRNPMNGEYSTIGITFDDKTKRNVSLLSESYGQIYRKGSQMAIVGLDNVAMAIEEIYQNSMTNGGFDQDAFNQAFEETLFEKNPSFGKR